MAYQFGSTRYREGFSASAASCCRPTSYAFLLLYRVANDLLVTRARPDGVPVRIHSLPRRLLSLCRFLLQASLVRLFDLVVLPVDDRLSAQLGDELAVFALALAVRDLVGDFAARFVEGLGGRVGEVFDLDDLISARGWQHR